MIQNIPKPKDYENVGFECLVQAYKNINQIDNGQLIPDVPREEIWQYNTIVLKTSIVLIHQGIEALLKSKISRKSPLLLLEQKRSDWKTLPNSDDIDFTDMYTISGEDLIRTFFATLNEDEIDNNFRTHFENVRVIRNKIVHGIGNDEIEPEEVLKLILWTFTYLNGKGSFWRALQDKFYDHPGHLVGDSELEFEEVQQYIHLDYLEALLGKGELNNHFEIDLKSRRYYCPECTGQDGILVQKDQEGNVVNVDPHPTSKWAFLQPNKSDSTNVFCLVCQNTFEVERIDCKGEEKKACKGNVLYLEEEADIDEDTGEVFEEEVKLCLTCMDIQKKK
ncbi:hypothetical protein [Flavivirga sp. 57AJ16]|uniref:hypothetical protein n=1 Tax=Flavivirga sp. 57AJ16 TaxID=3025307 RepID=UPI0023653D32|nr:hypothetical protein [Flavivirga sp. 57AJ16]MDD7888320.1 hypothetical protein [Flavivirga sp. 57AJ16]